MKINQLLSYLLWLLLAFSAAIIGLKSLREPDLYWIVRTGEWIWQNGEVVRSDPFSFTFFGTEWINVKWLFELIAFVLQEIGGMSFVPFIQVIANVLLLAVFGVSLRMIKSNFSAAAFAIAFLIFLVGADFRMTGRPELVSHLFTATFFMLWLIHEHKKNTKWLWILIPLQVVWTNAHEAYGTGIVIFGILSAGKLLSAYLKNRKQLLANFSWQYLWIGLALVTVLALNPRGIQMIWHPIEIFGQVGENKYTLELYGITTAYYWQQKESWLAIFIFGVLLIYELVKMRELKRYYPISKGLVLLAFFYLGTTAHRNLPFFFIVAFPFLYEVFEKVHEKTRLSAVVRLGVACLLVFGFYLAVASGKYYELVDSPDRIGLEEYPVKNPTGLSQFLKEKQLEEEVIFSDYLISSYLLWYNRPAYKSFIDLRDLDVYPAEFFDDFARMTVFPQVFEKAYEKYKFKAVALYRPQFANLHRYLFESPNWQLVYADAVAVLFVNQQLFAERKDDFVALSSQKFLFKRPQKKENSALADAVNSALNPFFQLQEVPYNHALQASAYLQNLGAYPLALSYAQEAVNDKNQKYESLLNLGSILTGFLSADIDNLTRNQYYNQAYQSLQQCKKIDDSRYEAYLALGNLLFKAGNYGLAEKEYLECLALEPTNKDVLTALANCQNGLMQVNPAKQSAYAEKWFEYMTLAHENHPSDLLIRYRLGISHCQRGRCEEAAPLIKNLPRLPELSDQEWQGLRQCQQRCL